MFIDTLFDNTTLLSGPPSGTVNVRVGRPVEGPNGKWIPCASEVADDTYVSCIFPVGPGCRQVCAVNEPTTDIDKALSRATELARTAAA
jgi:hypothetical protein